MSRPELPLCIIHWQIIPSSSLKYKGTLFDLTKFILPLMAQDIIDYMLRRLSLNQKKQIV
jgi:hypothetical protein